MSSVQQTNEKDDQAGPDHGIQDLTEHATEHEDANARQKPATDNGTDDTDNDVTHETEATTLHDLTGQPSQQSRQSQAK